MRRDHLILIGCAFLAFAGALGVTALVVSSPTSRVALFVMLALIPTVALLELWKDARAVKRFRAKHGAEGKDLLIVSSASPHWHDYIEENWVNRWRSRAVVLNRSDPDWNTRVEAALWRRLAGSREHTPLAIIVPPKGRPIIIRFFLAFRDYKHGRAMTLRKKEAELEAALESLLKPPET